MDLDVTYCCSTRCPVRMKCLRFTAQPVDYIASYTDFYDGGDSECERFIAHDNRRGNRQLSTTARPFNPKWRYAGSGEDPQEVVHRLRERVRELEGRLEAIVSIARGAREGGE